MRRFISLFALIASAGCSAPPESIEAALAFVATCRNYVDFARGLARRGWFDLAEEICDRVAAAPESFAENRAWLDAIRAEILAVQSEKMSDVAQARLVVDKAIKLLDPFLKDPPAHPLAFDARINAGWLRKRKAQLVSKAMSLEQDPAKAVQLQKEAIASFSSVVEYYKTTIKEFSSLDQNKREFLEALMEARLELPRSLLELAKQPGINANIRKDYLIDAIKQLLDFEFDFGSFVIAFDAMKLRGECHYELGDFVNAEAALRGAISLKTHCDKARIPLTNYHLSIVRGSWVILIRVLTKAGCPAEAVAAADQALREDPSFAKDPLGAELKREREEALTKMKEAGDGK